jgi:hypothetical protein
MSEDRTDVPGNGVPPSNVAKQDAPAPKPKDAKDLGGQLDDISKVIEKEFTEPVDETRVKQAATNLATAKMAIELLYEAQRQRADLKDHHAREEAAGQQWYRQMGARG